MHRIKPIRLLLALLVAATLVGWTPDESAWHLELPGPILDLAAGGGHLYVLTDTGSYRSLVNVAPSGRIVWQRKVRGNQIAGVSAAAHRILLLDDDWQGESGLLVSSDTGELVTQLSHQGNQLSADGRWILASHAGFVVFLYDHTGEQKWSHTRYDSAIASLAEWTGEVLIAHPDRVQRFTVDGTQTWEWRLPRGQWVQQARISPDGELLLLATTDAPPSSRPNSTGPDEGERVQVLLLDRLGRVVARPDHNHLTLLPAGRWLQVEGEQVQLMRWSGTEPIQEAAVPAGCPSPAVRFVDPWFLVRCADAQVVTLTLWDLDGNQVWQRREESASGRPLVAMDPAQGLVGIASGNDLYGYAVAPAAPVLTAPLIPGSSTTANTPSPAPPTQYPARQPDPDSNPLGPIKTSPGAELAVGYDAGGRVMAWVTLAPHAPALPEPGSWSEALAMVASLFQTMPELDGVWVARDHHNLELAYFPQSVLKDERFAWSPIRPETFPEEEWVFRTDAHWVLKKDAARDLAPAAVQRQLEAIFGRRLLSVDVHPEQPWGSRIEAVVKGLPAGGDPALRREWAQAGVAVTGRFYHRGTSLEELTWVSPDGEVLFQSAFQWAEYPNWWRLGMHSGGMEALDFFRTGRDAPTAAPVLDIRHRSRPGPWWETAQALDPVFQRMAQRVPEAQVRFAGHRRDGGILLVLELDLPADADLQQARAAQMKAALLAMEEPISEVWTLVRLQNRLIASRLDRMTYDALAYPGLAPIAPDLWPQVTTTYGEESPPAAPLTEQDRELLGVQLLTGKDAVRTDLGEWDNVSLSTRGAAEYWTYYSFGIRLGFDIHRGGTLYRMDLFRLFPDDEQVVTPRGVGLGSHWWEVEDAYGKPYGPDMLDPDGTSHPRRFVYASRTTNTYLAFLFDAAGKVERIALLDLTAAPEFLTETDEH